MCAKTNIFAGIPLGILVIFVFYVGAGLVSHAPIAFVNMAIQAFVIIRWLIPQLKFYFKKLNFRGAPYVSKKFKRILVIKYIIIAVCVVFLILNLDKINMEQFDKVLTSVM